MKKILLVLITLVAFLFPASVFAMDYVDENLVEQVIDENQNNDIAPQIMDVAYRKTNVTTYTEWSEYERVSDNACPVGSNGSISSNRTVTFRVDIKGAISGIDVISGGSITSAKNYTLPVDAGKCGYMAFRVKYKVEKGVRELYDMVTGEVISKNDYIVKVPQYGSYKILYDESDTR